MRERVLLLMAMGSVIGCTRDDGPLHPLGVGGRGGFGGTVGFGGFGGSGSSTSLFGSGGDVIDVPISGTGGTSGCWEMRVLPGEGLPPDDGARDAAADGAPVDGAVPDGGVQDAGSASVFDARAAVDAGPYPDVPPRCRWDIGGTMPARVDFQTAQVELGGSDGKPATQVPWVTACSVDGGADGFTYDDCKDPHELILCSNACDRFVSGNTGLTFSVWCPLRPNPW